MKRQKNFALAIALALSMGMMGCVEEYQEELPPRDGLYYPIGLEVHPNGRFLYVVNSNFDLRYRPDQGGTVTVIDTETMELLPSASPYLPSFGGHVALNENATRAYVTSRKRDQVTVLTVADQGQALFCEVDGERSSDTRPCTVGRLPDTREGSTIPRDPFGIAVSRTERTIGGVSTELDVVHLSHLSGENVTALTFPEGNIAGATLRSGALIPGGGNQLALRPGTQDVYVVGRDSNRIEGFRPFIDSRGAVEAIVRVASSAVVRQGTRMDARGIAFDESGEWMYVASRRPNALHILRVTNGTPQVVTSIPLERRPSEAIYHRGADGVARLYVPSYRQGIIEVIDPELEAVVDTIEVGRSPYYMVVDSPEVHCTAPGQRCWGYVSLFDSAPDGERRCDDDAPLCGQVAVIDLDPDSETFHTVIDTIE